jgi:hypothetical protein
MNKRFFIILFLSISASASAGAFCGFGGPGACAAEAQQENLDRIEQNQRRIEQQQRPLTTFGVINVDGRQLNCVTINGLPNFSSTTCN